MRGRTSFFSETTRKLGRRNGKKNWNVKTVDSKVSLLIKKKKGFPGGAVVESLPANAEDTGSSPGLGRSYMPRSN